MRMRNKFCLGGLQEQILYFHIENQICFCLKERVYLKLMRTTSCTFFFLNGEWVKVYSGGFKHTYRIVQLSSLCSSRRLPTPKENPAISSQSPSPSSSSRTTHPLALGLPVLDIAYERDHAIFGLVGVFSRFALVVVRASASLLCRAVVFQPVAGPHSKNSPA